MTDAFTVFTVDTIVLCGVISVTGSVSALTTYALTGKGRLSLVQGFTVTGFMTLRLAAALYVANN